MSQERWYIKLIRWILVIESAVLGGATAWWTWQAARHGSWVAAAGLAIGTAVWFWVGLLMYEHWGRRGRHG